MVSQPENAGYLDRIAAVSQSYQLQDTETVASPHIPVVSQPETSSCLDRTSAIQIFNH